MVPCPSPFDEVLGARPTQFLFVRNIIDGATPNDFSAQMFDNAFVIRHQFFCITNFFYRFSFFPDNIPKDQPAPCPSPSTPRSPS